MKKTKETYIFFKFRLNIQLILWVFDLNSVFALNMYFAKKVNRNSVDFSLSSLRFICNVKAFIQQKYIISTKFQC